MDDLELIKQKINIVDLVSEYLPLKKAGVNFKASCPFHQEKTPSFMVSPERGIWHCFGGCQEGGDVFKFLMKKEGVDFKEALEILAKRAGIVLKRRKNEAADKKVRLFEANSKSVEFFHYILTKHSLGKAALEYLRKRGVTDDTIKLFRLGYAPNSWDSLTRFLIKKGFKLPELVEAGLVVPSQSGGYDRFRGRIIFSLCNVVDQVLGFAGRILGEGEPKYINTPQTAVFDKSNFLFGIDRSKAEIKSKNQAILVEGEMDMVLSYQSGVKNIVATKGTALTSGQVELIKRYTDTILLCFDKDLAGDQAARRGIELADQAGLNIRVVRLEGGKDPADICLKDVRAWTKAVDEAEPIYDYYISSVSQRYNLKTAEGKKGVVLELIPIWSKISNPLVFEHYLQKLSAFLGTDENVLRKQIRQNFSPSSPLRYSVVLTKPIDTQINLRSRRELLEEYLTVLLLKIPPDLTFVPNFPETIFISENLRSLYILLVLYLDGISFKAKSFDINEFIKSVPPELVSLVDRLYLVEIDGKLANSKPWQAEMATVVAELKKALIKASLEKLSTGIKHAQTFGKIELLNSLNKRFRDLSVKLRNL